MLHLHRAERADVLADALGAVLRTPPADPFAPEVVAVPARGVERWLTQRLSHVLGAGSGGGIDGDGSGGGIDGDGSGGGIDGDGIGGDGICAGIEFPSPAALLGRALRVEDDPWDPARLPWALIEVIDGCLAESWCAALAAHLGGAGAVTRSPGRGRRWATAAHLAELYTSYGAARPQLVRAWAAGDDSDGAGRPLDRDLHWQAELWRRLRAHLGTPSPAERLPAACQALRGDPAAADLPERLSLFGATRLTGEQLAVLDALAAGREVHLWLPHPSPALWQAVRPVAGAPGRRREDPTRRVPRHPLLASMGRDVRELQVLLAGGSGGAGDRVAEDLHHGAPERPATLLGQLQADLGEDRVPAGRLLLDGDDRSVQVHACHGPARQVEVLRETLLGLFADDPTLEPRDVLVMCPDVETYAPLVTAAFGLGEQGSHPGHGLRVRLADRSLRQTNPLLDVVARLLELAAGRVTASQVLDLAATPGVRRCFGFGDEELERLRGWVAASGVRWGLDAQHRAAYALDQVSQNTWRTGLDRLLLGVTASEDGLPWLDLALPLDDVDSADVDLAGRLAELVDRLDEVLAGLTGSRPATAWTAALDRGLELLTAVADRDAWQLAQARRELAVTVPSDGGAGPDLQLGDVRAMLADRLRGRPTRANFRTGSLTVCTMVPMRSVPHRVLALLGLDDGSFPRVLAADGDDVLLREPLVGERDRRSEDRQLMLDAVLAAGEHLLVLHTGADPLSGARRPSAVPVGELLDVLDATATTADGTPVRDRVVVRHPLQPFDRRNFLDGALGGPGPFSFDRQALAGARRAARPRTPPPPFLPAPLAAREQPLELRSLVALLEHPVKAFLRSRLQVAIPGEEEDVSDAVRIGLEPLERWGVGDRMLLARLAGTDTASFRQAELRRGTLPPGPIGLRILGELEGEVEELAAATTREGPARTVDVRLEVDGRQLTGTVGGVHGGTVVRSTYSRLAPKHRLRAWAQLLALAAAGDGRPWRAATTGRSQGGRAVTKVLVAPPQHEAAGHLAALVELHAQAMCRPLPLDVESTHAYARQRVSGGSADMAWEAADKAWSSKFGAMHDNHYAYVWGEQPSFARAVADYPDFAAIACALWAPLMDAET